MTRAKQATSYGLSRIAWAPQVAVTGNTALFLGARALPYKDRV